jgi:hypothetical protein
VGPPQQSRVLAHPSAVAGDDVSLFIQTHRPSVDVALVVVVSVIVGSGLLTAMILQYPYSGAIAVQSDPLTEGPLSRPGDRM